MQPESSGIMGLFSQGDVTVRLVQEVGENIVELIQNKIPTDEKGMVTYHWLY